LTNVEGIHPKKRGVEKDSNVEEGRNELKTWPKKVGKTMKEKKEGRTVSGFKKLETAMG